MPTYDYKCKTCGKVRESFTKLADIDRKFLWCSECADYMVRQTSGPAFVINGFNAKNGYSNDRKE